MEKSILIRPYQPTDSIPKITQLLHKAYAKMAGQGMTYLASHQDDKTTEDRLTSGASFLALKDNAIVGTITVYGPHEDSEVPLYRQTGVCHFGQYAVDPDLQGSGLGKRLYQTIEDHCRAKGVRTLALDTAEMATQLIDLYQRWGFKVVDRVKWDVTNYHSVIMTKTLEP
ncbi:GNAT family N-acetyltransferase [candidate division TA06 bacterium]|uniref:GNAT family N-acetyltransferase n=1 Tax=candidate division TA06 bacterium TaxID=2250710 RepID=A0A933IA47_UNCT6|nr:GNAT family N-acetyltransferase [candidate division TA06 bacterium]